MSSQTPDFNPYESSDTTELSLEQQLIAEENLVGTVLGAIIGAIPGFSIFLILIGLNYLSYLAYIIPGITVGLFARFMGRGLKKKHNLITAGITLLCILIVHLVIQLPSGSIWLSLLNVVLAGSLAGRRLNREQSDAVFDYKIGLKRSTSKNN